MVIPRWSIIPTRLSQEAVEPEAEGVFTATFSGEAGFLANVTQGFEAHFL